MKKTRISLITQSQHQPFKLPKLNNSMIFKDLNSIQPRRRDKFYIRPEMKKILYSPFQDKKKTEKNQLLVESCITNINYSDLAEQHIERKIQSNLSGNQCSLDKLTLLRNKAFVGKQAPFTYYDEYKKLAKLIEKAYSNKQNTSESPFVKMLQKIQKFDILPLCMGLIKFQGDQNILNLNNYILGDKYIISLAAGLKNAKLIEKCYLSNNRITNKGMNELVKSLHHQISVLDVSFNKITKLESHLMELIINSQAHLQKLNLQKNQIRSQQVIYTLLNHVMYSKHLKILNLRGNGIGQNCLETICQLIEKDTTLQQFYIGENYLTASAGQKIFEFLANNKNIKIFDYSMNNLGEDPHHKCAESIANCLNKNKIIHHLDLSNNNFQIEGTKIISLGLENNHKIYGFHFNGNFGYVDSRGFLIVEEKQITSLHSLVEQKIDSYQICYKRKNISIAPQNFKNVCWICEGWYEQQFRFNIPEDFTDEKRFVYLHFDFQMYAPRLINLTQKNVKYLTMVPPKRYKYFFTFNSKQYVDKNTKFDNVQFPESFTYEMYHIPTTFTVNEVSQRKGKPKKMVNDWNEVIISTLPRNTGLVSKKQKEPWTYEKSIWAKQWKLENDDILKKCFEKDWKCSKLMNLVKNQTDQDKLKERLGQNYKAIKLVYKYFSAWSPFGDVWAVSNNAWTQFCQQSKIISKDTPLKITDLTFITTNSMSGADWKGNQLVPERGLVRFQFMEALVRLSEQKFKKNGITDTFTDSIALMLKDHVLPLAITIFQDKWRDQKYFVEENDMLLKKYRPIFIHVYKKNSKLKVKPGQKPFMCLSEFKGIMQKANLAGNLVLERDIYLSFNFAMMTQVDELENERFMKMTQIQFIQAVARCSQALPKTCTLSKNLENTHNLYYKFEWIMNEIKNTQCSEQIKNQFPNQGSIFDQMQQDD